MTIKHAPYIISDFYTFLQLGTVLKSLGLSCSNYWLSILICHFILVKFVRAPLICSFEVYSQSSVSTKQYIQLMNCHQDIWCLVILLLFSVSESISRRVEIACSLSESDLLLINCIPDQQNNEQYPPSLWNWIYETMGL